MSVPADATLANPSSAAAPRSTRRLLIIIAALALMAAGALMLLPHRAKPAPAPNLLQPDAAAPAAQVPVPKRVAGANAAQQSPSVSLAEAGLSPSLAATPGAPVPAAKEESPPAAPALTQRFDKLDTALTGAQASLDQQGEAIAALQRAVADLAEQFKAARPAKAARSASRRARRQVARTPDTASGEVLAVDTWNGQPVVTVVQGGTLHFLRSGERLGDMTLTGADAATQQARFGADVVARARAQVRREAHEEDAP